MLDAPEQWRDIPGYEGRYYISDRGHVAVRRDGELWGRKLNSCTHYLSFSVSNGTGKPQTCLYVHRVVARVFHGPRPAGMVIRHVDGNRFNNAVDNIAYGTPEENAADDVAHGKHARTRNGRSKLDERDVAVIKRLLADKVGTSALARAFGVTPTAIDHIKAGRQWR
jgi:hypothetical protein